MLDFLTLKPEVFGIDISDLSLKIIKLKKRGDYFNLSSFGEAEIKPGIIEGGEIKNEDALAEIIKKALSQIKGEKIKTKYVVASLPEERAFLQVIQMPIMEEKEIGKAVYFEAENYIPMPIGNVYLDSQVVSPIVNHLDHRDVLIAALPKKTVDSYLSSLQKSGLKTLVFETESQSVARSLIKGEESLEPLLLIDFGAIKASFVIFSGRSLKFTTSLPISSQKFTENIASGLKIDIKEAEQLKKEHGIEGGWGREIFNILKPDLVDFTNKIKTYLSYYQTHTSHEHLPVSKSDIRSGKSSDHKGVKKVILCGGAANLKGLDDFLSQELKLQVVLGNPWSNILPRPLKEVPDLPYYESLKYSTALGLALRGANL